jgi:hypothetical protein
MNAMDNKGSTKAPGQAVTRRFTDSEVATVLRKAAEIDEAAGAATGAGLSLHELQEIAKEVGISPEAIAKAAATLERRGVRTGGLVAGSPLVRRAVHSVDGELNADGIAGLVRLIDEKSDAAGEVSEALGAVRWTSRDRFHGMQVSITPENGETTIQVVEKALPRMRRVVHLLPAAWGAMLSGGLLASAGAQGELGLLTALILGVGGGAAAGRAVWTWLSARSRGRVERLADELSREARESVRRGNVVGDNGGS